MSRPIPPTEVGAFKAKSFPAYVFDAFNELIAANFCNGSASVLQKHVVERMLEKANDDLEVNTQLTKEKIFSNGYLNVEEAYKDAGWQVYYDRPAYNESYDASFTFRK